MAPAEIIARALVEGAPDDTFMSLVAARIAEAVATWPVAAPPEAFARFMAARLEVERPVPEAFAALRTADLWLACACLEAVAGAADVFVARYGPELDVVAARAARRTGREPDDLKQRVLVRLLVSEDGQPGKLSLYRGTGPLGGFVQVTAARLAVNLGEVRTDTPEPEDRLFARLTAQAPSPETHLADADRASALRKAFARACASLEPRAKAVLFYSACEGLSVDILGRMYGVHRATAARWVQDARESLVAQTRAELRTSLALSEDGAESFLRGALSRLEISIARHLAVPVVSAPVPAVDDKA